MGQLCEARNAVDKAGSNAAAAESWEGNKGRTMKSALSLRTWLKIDALAKAQMPLAQAWSHGCLYLQGSLGAAACHWDRTYVPRQDLEDSNTEGKKGRGILTNTIRFADWVKYLADTYLT